MALGHVVKQGGQDAVNEEFQELAEWLAFTVRFQKLIAINP